MNSQIYASIVCISSHESLSSILCCVKPFNIAWPLASLGVCFGLALVLKSLLVLSLRYQSCSTAEDIHSIRI